MYHHHPKKKHWYSQSHCLRFKVVQEWFNMFQYVLCNDWFRPLAALACLCLISWQCPILPVARQRSFVLPNVLMHWICKTRADHAGQTMKSNEITWCFFEWIFSSEITSYSHYVMTCHTALCICVLQWLSWTDSLHGHAWSLCAFGCGCALWRGLSTALVECGDCGWCWCCCCCCCCCGCSCCHCHCHARCRRRRCGCTVGFVSKSLKGTLFTKLYIIQHTPETSAPAWALLV